MKTGYIAWTVEEDKLLWSLVGKMSFRSMVSYFTSRTANALQLRSKRLGLESHYVYRIRTKNESFWETPNPTNCYWAGFIAADGCITEKRGATSLKLGLSIVDVKHLERFIEDTGFSGKIVEYYKKSPSTENISHMCRTSISSCDKWVADLKRNFNLCQGKTHVLQGPNLTDDYLKLCFLTGYLDGDGCVHWDKRKRKENGKGYPVIRVAGCGLKILTWINDEIINKKFKISFYKNVKDSTVNAYENHFVWCLTGLKAAKLFDAISTMEVPKLARKWQNPEFLSGLATYKKRFPSFFPDIPVEKV